MDQRRLADTLAEAKNTLHRFLTDNKETVLDLFLRSSGCLVLLLDNKGGINYANEAFRRLIGSVKVKAGEPVSRYLEANRLPELFDLERGQRRDQVIPLSSTDGSTYRVEATLFRGSDAVLLIGHRSLLTHSDVVEQMSQLNDEMANLSRELSKRTAELNRSNKELENFAFVASHDLQAPLRRITALCELLVDGYNDRLDETGCDYLRRIQAASSDMRTMISGLLEFSRVSSRQLNKTAFDLNALAERVASELKESLNDIDARISIDTLPQVVADEGQIRQLLHNLMENGLKYHKTGKPAEVRVYESRLSSNSSASSLVRFVVEDNGIGFDATHSDQIFGIFERLDGPRKVEGTGIGLSICKKVVERHGGSIIVESQIGEGARFIVTLPNSDP